MTNNPKKEQGEENPKYDPHDLDVLFSFLYLKPRFFNNLFFKTKTSKPLNWFLTSEAIENFTENKINWWKTNKDYAKYDLLVEDYCKKNYIEYKQFPFVMSTHSSIMLEWIYNLILPIGYIKHHPNGFISLIDMNDDQIIPYISLSKDELAQWLKQHC